MEKDYENKVKNQINGSVKEAKSENDDIVLDKEEQLKQRLEELRKRDPFIYR